MIKLPDGGIIPRHHDHVRIRSSAEVSRNNIPDDNMILPVTVPVDSPVPISIVPTEPQPEPAVATPIERYYRRWCHLVYYVDLNVPSMYRIVSICRVLVDALCY